jgi:hypothetical protein
VKVPQVATLSGGTRCIDSGWRSHHAKAHSSEVGATAPLQGAASAPSSSSGPEWTVGAAPRPFHVPGARVWNAGTARLPAAGCLKLPCRWFDSAPGHHQSVLLRSLPSAPVRRGSITFAKSGILAYIAARCGSHSSAPIRPLRVHRRYIGRAGYIGSGTLVVRFGDGNRTTADSRTKPQAAHRGHTGHHHHA